MDDYVENLELELGEKDFLIENLRRRNDDLHRNIVEINAEKLRTKRQFEQSKTIYQNIKLVIEEKHYINARQEAEEKVQVLLERIKELSEFRMRQEYLERRVVDQDKRFEKQQEYIKKLQKETKGNSTSKGKVAPPTPYDSLKTNDAIVKRAQAAV
ncbi:unnamed protein product [Caenorhabditis sp. 36 PRJEB53466]|nr:unnamed protein product [Caenorhabditis sp. 36 PRJEB53466]